MASVVNAINLLYKESLRGKELSPIYEFSISANCQCCVYIRMSDGKLVEIYLNPGTKWKELLYLMKNRYKDSKCIEDLVIYDGQDLSVFDQSNKYGTPEGCDGYDEDAEYNDGEDDEDDDY